MTEKQKRFCDEYLVDLNAKQAAIRAGYSEKTAHSIGAENLTKPELQEYIQKRLDEKEDALIAKQDEVLKTLTRIMRREELETVVVVCKKHKSHYDDNGKKVIDDVEEPVSVSIPTKVSDAIKAAELIGKRWGIFNGNQPDGESQEDKVADKLNEIFGGLEDVDG